MRNGDEPSLRGRLAPGEMFPAGEPSIRVRTAILPDGTRFRIAEAGAAGAPPVVLVHGWGASLYMWRAWFEPMARAGWRVVAMDLPGHGLSDKPDDDAAYTLPVMRERLARLLLQEGLQRAPIVAQSMGGTLALEIAVARLAGGGEGDTVPLVLVNPATFGVVRLVPLARALGTRAADLVLPWLVSRWMVARTHRMVYGDPSRISERDVDEYWAPSQFPAYARAMRRLVSRFDWRRPPVAAMAARLAGLSSPALVVLGSRDRLVREALPYVRALAGAGARIVVSVIEGGGHAVNEERPDEVLALALAHLGAPPR